MKHKSGFTLIELLVIIIILGILTALISGSFVTSIKKGRDARRKNDLSQIQRALELYYEDYKAYPTGTPPFGSSFCAGTCIPGSSKMYMVKMPNDPSNSTAIPVNTSTYKYVVESSGTYYYLFSCLENGNDTGSGVSQTGFTGGLLGATTATCGSCGKCKYSISSFNAPVLSTP